MISKICGGASGKAYRRQRRLLSHTPKKISRCSVSHHVALFAHGSWCFSVRDGLISKLNPVEMNGAHRSYCPPGVSLSVLQEITRWTVSPYDRGNILWLHGEAKSGKSMIATTLAHFFRDQNRLGAFAFFERDVPTRNNSAMLLRTIASQLAAARPSIAESIASLIKERPFIGQSTFAHQFTELILKPLQQESLQSEGPLIIVIDALDECGSSMSRSTLLSVLAEQSSKLPSFVRIVITSRPARDILDVFRCRNVVWKKVNDEDAWSEL